MPQDILDPPINQPLRAALAYARHGWFPIPLRGKSPSVNGSNWQHLRLRTDAQLRAAFRRNRNIGVLLGEPSGWLVDVDLDHRIAVELAPRFLPPTGCIFGRKSKPRSHWLYYAEGAETHKRQTNGHGSLVELRSTGCQTMFPGSTHPSGEPVEWDQDGSPAMVDATELRAMVDELADEVERRLGVGLSEHGFAERDRVALAPSRAVVPTGLRLAIEERARRYVAAMPPAISGCGGHDATFRVACVLVRGFALPDEISWRLLKEYSTRCQPPWNRRELLHKWKQAKRARLPMGYLLQEVN